MQPPSPALVLLLAGACAASGGPAERGDGPSAADAPPAVVEVADAPVASPPPAAPALAPPTDVFAARVLPVLEANCRPCHFPGGKMYERLPFDRPDTVRSVGEGILGRLEGEERKAVEEFLAGAD